MISPNGMTCCFTGLDGSEAGDRLDRLASLYRSRTRHRDCELRFGRMSRLGQDRGLRPSAFST
jgi:hypothetical protein